MPKRILVIPDIHGDDFWKRPVQKYIEQIDRVIFLGDYLDPYPKYGRVYSPQSLFDNFMDIVDLKRNHKDKVILLKGNHDQHYFSVKYRDLACASRCDTINWNIYHVAFNRYMDLFKLVHLEEVNDIPYIFSHAGLTLNWINKVNSTLWKLADNKIFIGDPDIINRINALDDSVQGQIMLAIVGRARTLYGTRSGSVLWADIEEHSIPEAPKAYGLNQVFQVFGHSRLDEEEVDILEYDNLALVDSEQCFMIDEREKEKIMTLRRYEMKT